MNLKKLSYFKTIVIALFIWKAVDFIVVLLAPYHITYLGFFPNKAIIRDYGLPYYLVDIANFDAANYISIARYGYLQFQQAFFPLLPLLIRFPSIIFGEQYLLIGLIISNVTFFAGIFLLFKFLTEIIGNKKSIVAVIFLLLFPTSFFFGSVYTEGLFLLLFIASIYSFNKKKYFLSSLSGFLVALTRITGVFTVFYFATYILIEIFREKDKFSKLKEYPKTIYLALVSPVLGLLFYSVYLYQTTGDALFFFSSQNAYVGRSTSLITTPQVIYRYFKILTTAQYNFQYFVSALELICFLFALIVIIFYFLKLKNKDKNFPALVSVGIFSLINLIVPTLTGTFTSMPRFILLSPAFFIGLSFISNIYIKILLGIIFLIFHIILLAHFAQGYFIA